MGLPNRYLELKQEQIKALAPNTLFKVKHVKGCQVLIGYGEKLFCLKALWGTDFKRGEILKLEGNLLVPKTQPIYL